MQAKKTFEVIPRFHTARDYSRKTHSAKLSAIASELGQSLLPWQQKAADVALEVDENGMFIYSTILITVPRQAGKTTLDFSASIQNALMGKKRRVWYTAQTGQHAHEKFLEMAQDWENCSLAPLAPRARRSNGSAGLPFINGSWFRPFAPVEGVLDGKQADKVSLDEFWYWTRTQYAKLRQSFSATKLTRELKAGQRSQTWIFSTEGTVESTALNDLLDQQRSKNDADPSICLIDYGIDADADPFDLDNVFSRHPGANHLFTREGLESFRGEFAGAPGEFARAFGNRRTEATERVIPAQAWKNAAWLEKIPKTDEKICFGVAVGIDNIDACIAVTQRHQNGTISAIVRDGYFENTYSVLDKLHYLKAKYPEAGFIVDPYSPSASLHDEMIREGFEIIKIRTADVISATQSMLTGVCNPSGATWRFKPHEKLDQAAELASKRYVQDGTWLFGRRASVGSIAPLEACVLSSFGVNHLPQRRAFQLG